MDPARAYLMAMVRQNRVTLASLSRALGRNHAYLHQFVHRGTPRQLPERLRRELAALLGTPEFTLLTPGSAPSGAAIPRSNSGLDTRASSTVSDANAPGSFPARLAMARAQSAYPLPSAFARAADIDRARYLALEEGEVEPSLDELERLSQTSGKSLDWLIRRLGRDAAGAAVSDGQKNTTANQAD